MGIMQTIFGGGQAATAVSAVGNVLDNLFTSKDEVLTHEAILTRLAQAPNMAQVELNKVEAGSRNVFVAGWRPFIGWVCGLGLFNMFLVNPWIQWFTGQAGPNLPKDVILELILALLGLGALRTVEKLKGKTR